MFNAVRRRAVVAVVTRGGVDYAERGPGATVIRRALHDSVHVVDGLAVVRVAAITGTAPRAGERDEGGVGLHDRRGANARIAKLAMPKEWQRA